MTIPEKSFSERRQPNEQEQHLGVRYQVHWLGHLENVQHPERVHHPGGEVHRLGRLQQPQDQAKLHGQVCQTHGDVNQLGHHGGGAASVVH